MKTLPSIEEMVEKRWHNWAEDPEFWKKDIIDTLTNLTDKVREEQRQKCIEVLVTNGMPECGARLQMLTTDK